MFSSSRLLGQIFYDLLTHNVNLSEHLEKAQAAININTVVGRPGITIPTYPRESDRIPIMKKIGLWILINNFGKNLYKMINTNIPPPI